MTDWLIADEDDLADEWDGVRMVAGAYDDQNTAHAVGRPT